MEEEQQLELMQEREKAVRQLEVQLQNVLKSHYEDNTKMYIFLGAVLKSLASDHLAYKKRVCNSCLP